MKVAPRLVVVQPSDGFSHVKRAAHRTLWVVLVRHRRAEHRDDGIVDELLHGSAEALKLVPRALVVNAEERTHVLLVACRGARRRSDEVDRRRR